MILLRHRYDRVENVRRIRLGLYEYGKIQLRYTNMYWEIRHGMIRLRIHRSINKSSTNQVRIKGNSWHFLTIREIFSLKLGIKCHIPLLRELLPK